MNKVYVLTIEETNEKERTLETFVFSTLELAKEDMEDLKHQFLCNNNIDEEESIIIDEEMRWIWYYDGDYYRNHYLLQIEEKEII